MEPANLRERLRVGCTDVHDRLDAAVGAADLAHPRGLTDYLAMNASAMTALRDAGASGRFVTTDDIARLAAAALSDLALLGGQAAPMSLDGPVSKSAVDYVMLGSRVGTSLLRRRWMESTDARVTAARAYFSEASMMPQWRAFCDDAATLDAHGPEADAALTDAHRLFNLFHQALLVARGETAHVE